MHITDPQLVAKAVAAFDASETYLLSTVAPIRKMDDDEQVIYAEVYAPNVMDTHGEFMRAEDIKAMAHKYLSHPDLKKSIDTNHDNVPNGSYPIESFIAREGDPDFTAGAWVLGIKVEDPDVWARCKSGDLNGYSFEAMVRKLPAVAILSVQRDNIGLTEQSADHQHMFFAVLDDDGKVRGGRTSTDAGHSHEIKHGTATEPAAGHRHRFFVE